MTTMKRVNYTVLFFWIIVSTLAAKGNRGTIDLSTTQVDALLCTHGVLFFYLNLVAIFWTLDNMDKPLKFSMVTALAFTLSVMYIFGGLCILAGELLGDVNTFECWANTYWGMISIGILIIAVERTASYLIKRKSTAQKS